MAKYLKHEKLFVPNSNQTQFSRVINLENIYLSGGWDAVQKLYDSLKRNDGTVPYEYFRQYHALARKTQLENQGPITDEMVSRTQEGRKCLCRWENKKLIICKMCQNK